MSNVSSIFLLDDPRLTIPNIKLSAPGVGGFLGRAAGAAKNLPTVVGNKMTQNSANFAQGVAEQHVPKLSPEQAAANAAPKSPVTPPAPKGILDHLSNMTGRQAAGLGASALALKGWVDPGQEYDEQGHAHQKSRLSSALSGAVTGAGAGLLAAPMLRGGAKLHAGSQPAPAPAAAPTEVPLPPAPPKMADYQTPVTNPSFRAGDRPSPAGGAPQTGNGVAAGKTASDDMSKEKAKEVTDPELNPEADKKLPYKVPSLKLKK